jgi:hypothetical protein
MPIPFGTTANAPHVDPGMWHNPLFDQVVTDSRCSPGSAQQALAITPDMTTLAKILAASSTRQASRSFSIAYRSNSPPDQICGEPRAKGAKSKPVLELCCTTPAILL